jgi:hypothetical protein
MDSKGHEFLTNESVAQAVKDFPPSLNWVRYFLRDTLVGSVYRDTTDIFTRGHWTEEGQRHHFMRFQGQPLADAYDAGSKWIYDNAYIAAQRLREIWRKKRGYYDPVYINEPLGDAIHALQDSYSGGHVVRQKDGDSFIIVNILVYDDDNKEAHGDWPGHAALDTRWKTDELGKEAIIAGRELIRIVVASSLVKNDTELWPRWNSLWATFVPLFLVCKFQR